MKSVMISINPKWCELIASGKKTVEVRKNRPKLEPPFKCYIYCTKGEELWKNNNDIFLGGRYNRLIDDLPEQLLNMKVVGELICDRIDNICLSDLVVKEDAEKFLDGSCLTKQEVLNYLGYNRGTPIYDAKHFNFYAWHISNLIIYDNPKLLGEFQLTKPPQSWRYVEEVGQ